MFLYLLGLLGMIILLLTLRRRGISSKGFRGGRGLTWANLNRLNSVKVSRREKDIRVDFTGRYLSYDTQYYEKEDYQRIISILQENVPYKILRIE